MSPLALLKFVVDKLQGTVYEPWANLLLFLLLGAVVVAALALLIGRLTKTFLLNTATSSLSEFKGRRGFSPEWQASLNRAEPYFEIAFHTFFAFVGLLLILTGIFAFWFAGSKAPWWFAAATAAWTLFWALCVRLNLERLSWALRTLRQRRKAKLRSTPSTNGRNESDG